MADGIMERLSKAMQAYCVRQAHYEELLSLECELKVIASNDVRNTGDFSRVLRHNSEIRRLSSLKELCEKIQKDLEAIKGE